MATTRCVKTPARWPRRVQRASATGGPRRGVLRWVGAISGKSDHSHGRRYDPETEVTVTSGGTEAIFDAVAAVVHPGDEVIVLEPCYDSYIPAIVLSGGGPGAAAARAPDYPAAR